MSGQSRRRRPLPGRSGHRPERVRGLRGNLRGRRQNPDNQ